MSDKPAEGNRRKWSTTVYLEPEQVTALREISARTKVPVAEYIRQGVDLLLASARAAGPVKP